MMLAMPIPLPLTPLRRRLLTHHGKLPSPRVAASPLETSTFSLLWLLQLECRRWGFHGPE
jgi:hypothetical protein